MKFPPASCRAPTTARLPLTRRQVTDRLNVTTGCLKDAVTAPWGFSPVGPLDAPNANCRSGPKGPLKPNDPVTESCCGAGGGDFAPAGAAMQASSASETT